MHGKEHVHLACTLFSWFAQQGVQGWAEACPVGTLNIMQVQ